MNPLGTCCFIAGICTFICGCSDSQSSAESPKPPPTVTAASPVRMSVVEWDEYVGRLAPLESVDVRARVSGYLAETRFQEGEIVDAGDLLAIIDQRPFLAEVRRNEATLRAVQARLEQAQSDASKADADLKRAAISRDLAESRKQRAEALRRKNAATVEAAETRATELAQSESDVAVARAHVELTHSMVAAARADIDVAKANLETARLNLQYTEIRAAITGRISKRLVTEGNLIIGGENDSTLLTTIVSVDPVHCYFDTDEKSYLKYVHMAEKGFWDDSRNVRSPVYMALASEKGTFPHWGHMDFVENRLDNTTGTMRGRAIFSNKSGKLTPGLFARIRIPGSLPYETILIPDRAIMTDQAEKYVLILDKKDHVQRREVTLGPISHGLRIIQAGLTGVERVILDGQQRARPGKAVIVKSDTIVIGEESLPNKIEPVPREKWLTPRRNVAANVMSPEEFRPSDNTVDARSHGKALK